ncbi:MAG: hypothetical protein C5B54_04715 [Acidobacteria bacterium]|nr:MAG: hypothetical protein C5B54_04715 [Acidobacteriota bacterium]
MQCSHYWRGHLMARPTLRQGSRGSDVVVLQNALSIKPADGIFGLITEQAVKNFQADNGLVPDGIVGPVTWEALDELIGLPKPPPPSAGDLTAAEVQQITTLARQSAIQAYNWKGRGIMPPGYCKGMAIAYACAFRKYNVDHAAFREIGKANSKNDSKDVLSWYASTFNAAGMNNDDAGVSTLRHVYAFMMGLGMRESSGRHCEGRDMSASNVSAITCEAGLFQTSWNAKACSPTILQGLFNEYRGGKEGYQSIFKEGVYCSSNSWKNYGVGDGLQFQKMAKEQPLFAVEVAAVTMRNLRRHYGPINRRDVELRKEANELLMQVQDLVAPVIA